MYEYFIRPIKNGYLIEVTPMSQASNLGIERLGDEGEYYCKDFKAVIELVSKIEKSQCPLSIIGDAPAL